MINKVKKFTLKEKDFATGKMITPPRSEWKTCNCCGRPIVQGVVMDNSDHIGNDCADIVARAQTAVRCGFPIEKSWAMMGVEQRVKEYATLAAA